VRRRSRKWDIKNTADAKNAKRYIDMGLCHIYAKKSGCTLFNDNLIFGSLPTEYLEVITAKKKFPFGYDVKERDNK
jgi:hypothetical protein